MKTQTNLVNIVLKSLLSLMLAAPLFSCANLDEVWEKFEEEDARLDSLEDRLDSLESSLNNQIKALDEILSGSVNISECKKNNDGSTTIILTDETSFTVYPKSADYSTLLTYVEEGGVKYWAFYDAKGKVTVMKDKNGNKIPVEAELPVVEEVDGEFILSIGGNEYTTGYTPEDVVTVFSDYELNMDESGNVYSVTFTFGEDMTFTISVADYKGLSFHLPGDVNNRVLKDFFVKAGTTSKIRLGLEGVVDYVMQIPDGWRIKEVVDEHTAEVFLNITAPEEANVTAGAAVASGDLKVVAVLEDGKSMVAKLELSTSPFKELTATSTNALIKMRKGVDKVIFGISLVADYNKETIIAGADAMLNENGNGVSDTDVDIALSKLLGKELTPGDKYILWAIPVFFQENAENDGWSIDADLMTTYNLSATSVIIDYKKEDLLFNDAKVSVKIEGVESYYGGTIVKSDDFLTEVVYEINSGLADSYTEPMTYTGSAFSFPVASGIEPMSEETYVTWVVLIEDGKTEYTVRDVMYKEYTLPALTAGGNIEVEPGTAVISKTSIEVPLTAEDAARIYYAWLPKKQADRIQTDDARADYLMDEGVMVSETSVKTLAEGLVPDVDINKDGYQWKKEMTLFAMAVDATGKYGTVYAKDYATETLVYNDLTVSVKLQDGSLSDTKAAVVVTVADSDADEFVYWIGKTTDDFWLSGEGSGFDNKKVAANKKIALDPTNSAVARSMSSYPIENNVISMSDLTPGSDYVVMVLVKDDSGKYSKAGVLTFATLGFDLGEDFVAAASSKWEDTKTWIENNIVWNTNEFIVSGEFSRYSFDIKIPADLTAFIACYVPDNERYPEVADKISYIETECMKKVDLQYNPAPEDENKPTWYDDEGDAICYGMFTPYRTYVHGCASWKGVTYFSSVGHTESTCPAWDSGECSAYAAAKKKFEDYCSIDYWREQAVLEDQPEWGRPLSDPEKREAFAQAYYKLYYKYYKDAEPIVYVNNGDALKISYNYGSPADDSGKINNIVTIVLKDNAGNYYEPMYINVPDNYTKQ